LFPCLRLLEPTRGLPVTVVPGRVRRRRVPVTLPTARSVRRIAHETLGFDTLWPGQEEALLSVLSGCDTLVLLPTGAGKSAIYQVAGTQITGPTVVVSPLIALQRDQLQN